MRGIQVTFAFVVALILMSGVFYGIWYYSMSQMIGGLPKVLEQTIPGKVKYSRVETVFHPFHSKLKLVDSSISMMDPKTGASVVMNLGDLELVTKPFNYRKIEVMLPKEVRAITTFQGRSNEYRTTFIDPILEWNKNQEGYDISLSVSGVLVKGRQNGYFVNLLKLGYAYLQYEAETGQWSSVMNNLDVSRIETLHQWPSISSISFNMQSKGSKQINVGYFLAAAGTQDKVLFDTMMMQYLKDLSYYSQLDMSEFRVVLGDTWYSYKGPVSVSEELYLELGGSLSSNKFSDMMEGIKGVMGQFPLALDRMLKRIGVEENKTQTVSISTNETILNINGAPVGVMPTLPEQFNLHGRGER